LETEANRCLSFLDLFIKIEKNHRIILDWFQKPFLGRFLSYFSNHPISHKVGTIYNLVDRAINLSHPMFHEKNLTLCIKLLLDNGYPLSLIFEKINSRLKKIFVQRTITIDNFTNSEIERKIIVVPYVNPISEKIQANIDKSKAMISFRCINTLRHFVKVHKDQDHILSKNNVVYKISCNDCDASYVGQTKRQLKTRLKEHKHNLKQDCSKHSVISEHIVKYNHFFDWDNTKIIDRDSNYYKRIVSQMIHIKEQRKGLNLNSDTELLNESYFYILSQLTN